VSGSLIPIIDLSHSSSRVGHILGRQRGPLSISARPSL
jgi:hypothetical protein